MQRYYILLTFESQFTNDVELTKISIIRNLIN